VLEILETRGNVYLIAFFKEDLIVFAQSDTEDDRGDVLEAVNPFFAFAALATDVKHTTWHMLA
jgi:hypothetical protein